MAGLNDQAINWRQLLQQVFGMHPAAVARIPKASSSPAHAAVGGEALHAAQLELALPGSLLQRPDAPARCRPPVGQDCRLVARSPCRFPSTRWRGPQPAVTRQRALVDVVGLRQGLLEADRGHIPRARCAMVSSRNRWRGVLLDDIQAYLVAGLSPALPGAVSERSRAVLLGCQRRRSLEFDAVHRPTTPSLPVLSAVPGLHAVAGNLVSSSALV